MPQGIDPASFLNGGNAPFIAELYGRWLEAPESVDQSWAAFFADLKDESLVEELKGPGWAPPRPRLISNGAQPNGHSGVVTAPPALAGAVQDAQQAVLDSIRALTLIRSYRVRGHLEATLDPLGLDRRENHPDLDHRTYGFTDTDLGRRIFIDNLLGLEYPTLQEIIDALRAVYCGPVGTEYMHIQDLGQRRWIQARIEAPRNHTDFTV